MGLFRRLLGATPPERREALALALTRNIPNSFDPKTDERARLAVSRRRIGVRNMDQLIGMCNMILADGAVEDAEARLLLNWMEANIYAAQDWPGNVLYERIVRAMADDVIDPGEERELLEVIQQIAGSFSTQESPPVSGAIPFDDPSPNIAHEGANFVVTGQFVFGTRRIPVLAIAGSGTWQQRRSRRCW